MTGPDFAGKMRDLEDCFARSESGAIQTLVDLQDELPVDVRTFLLETVERAIQVLVPLVHVIQAAPIRPELQEIGGPDHGTDALVEALCRWDGRPVELAMPTGAMVGRAFIFAKINFFKALRYCLPVDTSPSIQKARRELLDCVDDGVFSRLADELLVGAASNPGNAPATRHAAARHLLELWRNCILNPVSEFPEMLLSAWRARRHVRDNFGALMGVGQLFDLLRGQVESKFVDYFMSEGVTVDRSQAFREFLFGLPHEDLLLLQEHMDQLNKTVLTREEAYRILDRPPPPFGAGESVPSAEEVYGSYRRRRIRAEYRALSGAPGPKKTAEGYIMESFLKGFHGSNA